MASIDSRLWDHIRRHRWLAIGLLMTVVVWGWVDVMPRGVVNHRRIHEHRTDFTVYTEAGAAFFDGRDPYEVSNPRGWRYLYPPMFAIVVAPLHALAPTSQVTVWFALSVVMLVGCYYEMRRLLALMLPSQREDQVSHSAAALGLAGLLVTLIPALNCLQRGQVEVFKLYLMLLGLRLALAGRRPRDWCFAGIVLAVPAVLKLTPLLPVACLILYEVAGAWSRRGVSAERSDALWRGFSLSTGLGTGLLLFTLFIPASLIGWNANLRHLHTWYAGVVTKAVDVRSSDFSEDVRTVRNQSLDNAAYRFGNWMDYELAGGPNDSAVDFPHDATLRLPMDDRLAGQLIVASRVLALAVLLAFVLHAASAGSSLSRAAVFGLGCVATLVVCPVARGCYFVLFLPAVVFGPLWLTQLGRGWITSVVAWLPGILVCTYYLGLPFSGRIGLLGLGTAIWFFATCVLIRRSLADRAGQRNEQSSISPQKGQSFEPSAMAA